MLTMRTQNDQRRARKTAFRIGTPHEFRNDRCRAIEPPWLQLTNDLVFPKARHSIESRPLYASLGKPNLEGPDTLFKVSYPMSRKIRESRISPNTCDIKGYSPFHSSRDECARCSGGAAAAAAFQLQLSSSLRSSYCNN